MSRKKILESDYNKIVDMYNSGMTQPEIATLYNCSVSTISSVMKKMNVHTRLGGSNNTNDKVLMMCEMYKNGKLLREIADEFGTTRYTVSKLLKNNGIEVDRFTYHFDEHYFDEINSQDKAYILGLLWADGHNRVNKGSVILELQEEDKNLLENINKVTKNERPLRKVELCQKNPNWKNQYNLLWQSKYLSDLLNKYGMCQRKSLVLEFPNWLDENLYSHFVRGYLDGDGCICCLKDNRRIQVSMVGTRMFLECVQRICRNIGVKAYITHDDRSNDVICQLAIVSNLSVITFLNWIYYDANLKMERKYNKYQQFINNINNSYCV